MTKPNRTFLLFKNCSFYTDLLHSCLQRFKMSVSVDWLWKQTKKKDQLKVLKMHFEPIILISFFQFCHRNDFITESQTRYSITDVPMYGFGRSLATFINTCTGTYTFWSLGLKNTQFILRISHQKSQIENAGVGWPFFCFIGLLLSALISLFTHYWRLRSCYNLNQYKSAFFVLTICKLQTDRSGRRFLTNGTM